VNYLFDEGDATKRPPLGRNTLIAVYAMGLVALAASTVFIAKQHIGGFKSVEAAAMAQKATQLYRAFESDLRQLQISNRDYAEWDDAADFSRDRNKDFIQGNFSPTSLQGMEVDLVWIVDPSGTELYSGLLTNSGTEVSTPAPPGLLEQLRPFAATSKGLEDLSPAQRVLHTNSGLLAFSAIEVTQSDRSDPTGVVMLFARFVGQGVLARMNQTTHLPVSMTLLGASHNNEAAKLSGKLVDWLATAPINAETFVIAKDDNHISSHTIARDVAGRPAALFSTQGARDVYSMGRRITLQLVGAIAGLFLVFGGVFTVLIYRLQRSIVARQRSHARYRKITAQLQEILIIADVSTRRVVEANEVVLRLLSRTRSALQARSLTEVFSDLPVAVVDDICSGRKVRAVCEARIQLPDGNLIDIEIVIARLDDDGKSMLSLAGRDITHRREADELQRASRQRLSQLATRDVLTGLPNRLFLQTRLPKILNQAALSRRILGVAYLDIDHFKNINDSGGHASGDQLLRIIAKRLQACVSESDMVVRMGGDEFVVVLALMPDIESIEMVAARLQVAIQAPMVIDNIQLSVSASIGIAVYPQDGIEMDSLLKFADIALYQAKAAGRHCHRFFAADMNLRVSEQVALEQALRHAIGTDQLYVEFQPIMHAKSGRLASMEALMRWRHPELGQVPPGKFIPIAEESGLIEAIGEIAIRQTVAQLRQWSDMRLPKVPIAVNVAPTQLDRADFVQSVARIAAEAGIDMTLLRFEITESAVVRNIEHVIGTLQALRDHGSKILVDDFGTGYSNLSHLARLPVDTLKIDRSFVQDMDTIASREAIVRSVISMAKELRLSITAEGVETEAQFNMLRELGCTFIQGYYYSRPLPARRCTALLRKAIRKRLAARTG
jgi:diguanylate cyclase (GGDEF)-like protein/PAS domain S-box-containing protein